MPCEGAEGGQKGCLQSEQPQIAGGVAIHTRQNHDVHGEGPDDDTSSVRGVPIPDYIDPGHVFQSGGFAGQAVQISRYRALAFLYGAHRRGVQRGACSRSMTDPWTTTTSAQGMSCGDWVVTWVFVQMVVLAPLH